MRNYKSQAVKDILAAIASVKRRALQAKLQDNMPEFRERMGDLIALEVCLVIEAQKLIDHLEVQKDYELSKAS